MPTPEELQVAPSLAASPSDIRGKGWFVAAHNDYMLNGERHTFWLFTKPVRRSEDNQQAIGYFVKGEGLTDAEALNRVRRGIETVEGARIRIKERKDGTPSLTEG